MRESKWEANGKGNGSPKTDKLNVNLQAAVPSGANPLRSGQV